MQDAVLFPVPFAALAVRVRSSQVRSSLPCAEVHGQAEPKPSRRRRKFPRPRLPVALSAEFCERVAERWRRTYYLLLTTYSLQLTRYCLSG